MTQFNSLPNTKFQVSNSKRSHEAAFVIWSLELGTSDQQLSARLPDELLCRE